MKKYEEELDTVFSKYSVNFQLNNVSSTDNESLILHVSDVFKDARDYINSKTASDLITLVYVPSDLNSLLFNFEGGEGFLLTFGKSKLVLVLFESADFVTFLGRIGGSNNKNIKLLRLGVKNSKNGVYEFVDNSGAKVQLHEAALQVIKWGMS